MFWKGDGFLAKNKNWRLLKKQKPADSSKYRDVYEDQQLERSQFEEKQKPTFRIILTVFLTLLVFGALHSIISVSEFVYYRYQLLSAYNLSDYVFSDRDENRHTYYQAIDEEGNPFGERYDNKEDVPKPEWYLEAEEDIALRKSQEHDVIYFFKLLYFKKTGACLVISIAFFGVMYQVMMRNLEAQNMMSETKDINQYQNDQHIALPEEVQRKFDWFPDAGAHSSVLVSSMISHVALKNKGLKKIKVAKRAAKDILDDDGNILYYEDEILLDDDGEPIFETKPIIDEKFGDELFEVSGVPKQVRKYYDASIIPYNKGNKNRDKQKNCDTVADLINKDWEFPAYEPQRPGGAYIVDTDPVNTMVLAITRAGKGQTIIEPTIDMWTREKNPNNMVINDPKGELLVKNYVKGTVRGFQIVQFNLINAMKTDIYNPLALAADAAREGDFTKCALYVENIAEVFFPVDGGEDPVWPTAANNAFKRAAYGLIDFYLEEEKEMRLRAAEEDIDPSVLETKIDELWGKVTLYNCYQLFVQMSSKKLPNPLKEFQKQAADGRFNLGGPMVDENGEPIIDPRTGEQKIAPDGEEPLTPEEFYARQEKCKRKAELFWENKPEADLLTLYFNATDYLPRNQMRTLVSNVNNSLRAMGGAEKMMASCDLFRSEKLAA